MGRTHNSEDPQFRRLIKFRRPTIPITHNCARTPPPPPPLHTHTHTPHHHHPRHTSVKQYVISRSTNNILVLVREAVLTVLSVYAPQTGLESITPTVMNLESKLEFTRVRYLALSYSSLYSKLCLASSALGHPGSCCMLMT